MNFPLSTFHFPPARRSRRSGFTLIEILVATTILLVIVILASLVFQQTTGAYQTGERKVNAQVALRNVMGAMTRDLALAVDSRDYDGVNNNFGSESMSFVALTGSPGRNVSGEEGAEYTTFRTAHVITYSSSGERTETPLSCKRQQGRLRWSTESKASAKSSLYDKDSFTDIKDGSFGMSFKYEWPAGDSGAKLPERIFIRVELEGSGQTTAVGAGSGGRRGWEYADDNIYVGFRPQN
jgi:prepilin-type N-terminal cleavage/methylation domain-containing protein